jgi:hypothetical protein
MKLRAGLLVTCAASAVAIGFGPAISARAGDLAVKAAPVVVAEPVWWYEGFAEVGGRVDLNNPDKKTLGQFYNYRDLRPGVYGNFFAGAHRTGADPLDFEIWGKNIGWDDQAYGLDLASPGSYYLTAGWDETPRVYSWNAKTMYNGVGSNNLTLPNSASVSSRHCRRGGPMDARRQLGLLCRL